MFYSEERTGLTQEQAIANLRAVISSTYFGSYEFYSQSRISSDMIRVDSVGGIDEKRKKPFKVKDLEQTFHGLIDEIELKGTLYEASVQLTPSEEELRARGFEERLFEDGLSLPLNFMIKPEGHDLHTYAFRVVNLGLKQSYFESQGLNFPDAKRRLANWYRALRRNLKKILPHQ